MKIISSFLLAITLVASLHAAAPARSGKFRVVFGTSEAAKDIAASKRAVLLPEESIEGLSCIETKPGTFALKATSATPIEIIIVHQDSGTTLDTSNTSHISIDIGALLINTLSASAEGRTVIKESIFPSLIYTPITMYEINLSHAAIAALLRFAEGQEILNELFGDNVLDY